MRKPLILVAALLLVRPLHADPTHPGPMTLLLNLPTGLLAVQPEIARTPSGHLLVAWQETFAATRAGRYLVLDPAGNPTGPVQVDLPGASFGSQQTTACALWPSGRAMVIWVDGPAGAPPTTASPDGHGTGIVGRWFLPGLVPATSLALAAGNMAGDQLDPRVSANHRGEAVIGATTDLGGVLSAFVHRVTDAGQTFDVTSVPLPTTGSAASTLNAAAMTPTGDHVVAWSDVPSVVGGMGARARFARFTTPFPLAAGALVATGSADPAPANPETQGPPALATDPFGNFTMVWASHSGGNWELRRRDFKRGMISFSNPTPPAGTTLGITLDSPSDPTYTYFLFLSLGFGPVAIDTREIRLTPDLLTLYGRGGPANGVLAFSGNLDSAGTTMAPALLIPNIPILSGLPVNLAFVTQDPWGLSPSGIHTISDTATFTIQ